MRMYVFEGTPDEISSVVQTMRPISGLASVDVASMAPAAVAMPAKSIGGPDKFVTAEFARRTLRRRPLSDPMRAALKALYAIGDGWVSTADLHAVSGYKAAQFAGLMGAFGRRMANTDGFDNEAYFFDFQWNAEASAWEYRLPATVREALELERLV